MFFLPALLYIRVCFCLSSCTDDGKLRLIYLRSDRNSTTPSSPISPVFLIAVLGVSTKALFRTTNPPPP